MQLRLTFVDTHVRTCEAEAPDDLDVFDLNTLTDFVMSEIEATGRGSVGWKVVNTNWVDQQIVDVKVKEVGAKSPDRWVGLENLRPTTGVNRELLRPAARVSAAAPRAAKPPAPEPEPMLF